MKIRPSEPLLSILIPTFNREKKIKTAIVQWVECARSSKLKEKMEIVISDNCSTDQTKAVCQELIQTYDEVVAIRYFRNDTNLGAENNYFIGLQHCEGHYVWTFSDDDSPEQYALQHVEDLIFTKSYDYIFVNYAIKVGRSVGPSDLRLQTAGQVEMKDIFTSTNFASSYIGSNIFRKKKINFELLKQYVGQDWIHMFLLRGLSVDLKAYVVTAPIIIMNGVPLKVSRAEKNKTDTRDKCDYYMLAHLNFLSFCRELGDFGFSYQNTKRSRNYLKSITVRQIFYLKYSQRQQSSEQLNFIVDQLKKHFDQERVFCLLLTVLVFTPTTLLNPIYVVGSHLIKLKKSISRSIGQRNLNLKAN